MSLDVKTQLTALIQQALASVAPAAADTPILLERPRDAAHGDFASNLAMQLARSLKKNPRDIARQLVNELPASPLVAKAEVAGAGFINFTLVSSAKTVVIADVLKKMHPQGGALRGLHGVLPKPGPCHDSQRHCCCQGIND